jgi:phenylpropionate dioxygenase-like ring-hydroxylating dioxygenase large terminal subunit
MCNCRAAEDFKKRDCLTTDSLARLLAERKPSFSLDQFFYNSPQIFQRDIERVYLRHWLFAGPSCRIPKLGDYFLYQVANESIIIVRGKDNRVQAFFNVCRHRGSQLCSQQKGNVKRFVCPYHSWTYDVDGRLLAARHFDDDFDLAGHGLEPCHVCVVGGFIFVCLGKDAPNFDDIASDIETYFAPHQLERAKIAVHWRQVVHANWKLVVENFSECYHCGPAHPELAQVMSYVRAFDSRRAADERASYTARWEENARRLGHLTGKVCSGDGIRHEVCRIPIREGFQTQSRGGQPVAPLMGNFREYDGGITATQFLPFNWLVACNDHAMLPRVTPLSPFETEVEATWLVREDAVEGADYNAEEVSWMWRSTLEQDVRICEGNQKGVSSRHYRPGPYSKMEEGVEQFIQWYLGEIKGT